MPIRIKRRLILTFKSKTLSPISILASFVVLHNISHRRKIGQNLQKTFTLMHMPPLHVFLLMRSVNNTVYTDETCDEMRLDSILLIIDCAIFIRMIAALSVFTLYTQTPIFFTLLCITTTQLLFIVIVIAFCVRSIVLAAILFENISQNLSIQREKKTISFKFRLHLFLHQCLHLSKWWFELQQNKKQNRSIV